MGRDGMMMKRLDSREVLAELGLEHLKTASCFGALSDQAIAFLLEEGRVFSLAAGETVFRTGEPGDSFFIVLEGRLDYVHSVHGEEVPIRIIDAGQQLGYVSMLGLFERLGIGRAFGPAKVLEIPAELFYRFHEAYPFDFGIMSLNLSRDMARAIREVVTQLADANVGRICALTSQPV